MSSNTYDDILSELGVAPVKKPITHDMTPSGGTNVKKRKYDDISSTQSFEMWLDEQFPEDQLFPPSTATNNDQRIHSTCSQFTRGHVVHKCFCGSKYCKKAYKRHLRHARVLEQSTQLVRYVNGVKYKNVQIIIPSELQPYIGHGSCAHVFSSLKLFMKYLQLELGWRPQDTGVGYSCTLPTEKEYNKARDILLQLPFDASFYVQKWVPTFHVRFVQACGGLKLLKNCTARFFSGERLRLLY